jgi:hypothetical protein
VCDLSVEYIENHFVPFALVTISQLFWILSCHHRHFLILLNLKK